MGRRTFAKEHGPDIGGLAPHGRCGHARCCHHWPAAVGGMASDRGPHGAPGVSSLVPQELQPPQLSQQKCAEGPKTQGGGDAAVWRAARGRRSARTTSQTPDCRGPWRPARRPARQKSPVTASSGRLLAGHSDVPCGCNALTWAEVRLKGLHVPCRGARRPIACPTLAKQGVQRAAQQEPTRRRPPSWDGCQAPCAAIPEPMHMMGAA